MEGSPYKNLRDIPTFQSLSEEQCVVLGPMLTALRLSAGAVLLTEGRISDSVFVIVAGDVHAHAPSGLRTQAMRGPGLVIGMHEQPTSYSISMQSDGAALCFPSSLIATLNLFEFMGHFSLAPSSFNFSEDDTSPPDLIVLSRMLACRRYAQGLDLGCGAGRLSAHLLGHAEYVTMLDRNVDVLHEAGSIVGTAARQGALDGVVADFHALPFHDHTFDLVVSRLAFHESNRLSELLSGVVRILEPRGHFALIDVIPPCSTASQRLFGKLETAMDPNFCNPPSDTVWVQLLSNAGFINIKSRTLEISRTLNERPGGVMAATRCQQLLREASEESLSEMGYQHNDKSMSLSQLRWKDRRVVIVAERGEQ